MSAPAPNVLFISVDQWPGYLMGCAGHPVIETPTLDRLAEVGTRYTRCYSEVPICIPARRSMMTGSSARVHGDRDFQPALAMPDMPTLAQCFRDGGYQAFATGKLHVYPPRDRIGFDDVMLAEEGRGQLGGPDDYEIFLADAGRAGKQFLHGMSNNEYSWRPWHLPEDTHVTNWTTTTAARMIKRRDPTRPAFWHVSYTHPHPPLAPLASYIERYRNRTIDDPIMAEWARDPASLPFVLRAVQSYWPHLPPEQLADMRRAFYALCTHIDHQIRILIGTLREEKVLNDTILCFVSDHGDMLGDDGLYAKRLMYEGSANVPFILVDRKNGGRVPAGAANDRLVGLQDIMPTLLDLAGLPVPETCDGLSAIGTEKRDIFYGECLSSERASRMVHDGRYKLIWYPAGNRFQLFDLQEDPREEINLSGSPEASERLAALKRALLDRLYGSDEAWVKDGELVGVDEPEDKVADNRQLSGQRGLHYPPIPPEDPSIAVGSW
ncbi:sulfatase-like hydrolase/transferase [Pararhizobium mangrovi]|uniref:Arylsulfatase n=1 Tax=Pararhizobium mangrovi TaxID=2590452 RepID=A0A506UE45_9HYPH|nr:sulfatase-like hydrolase/transferase [Pararhizobium mangrovi]TPW31878.1 arylsulfatase [Pararhizobium mangrovi]